MPNLVKGNTVRIDRAKTNKRRDEAVQEFNERETRRLQNVSGESNDTLPASVSPYKERGSIDKTRVTSPDIVTPRGMGNEKVKSSVSKEKPYERWNSNSGQGNDFRNAKIDDFGQAIMKYQDWNRAINEASERNDAIGLGALKKGANSMAQYFVDNADDIDRRFGSGTTRDLLGDMVKSTDFIDANMQYLNGTNKPVVEEEPIDYANRSTAESVEDYMRALANGEEGGNKFLGGVAATLGTVVADAASVFSLPAMLWDSQFRNRKSAEELNNAGFLERLFPGELDRDAWYMIAPRAAQAGRETVSQNIENRKRYNPTMIGMPSNPLADKALNKIDSFLYQNALSMADFITQGVMASSVVEGLGMGTAAMAKAAATGEPVLVNGAWQGASQLQQELVNNVSLSIMGSGAMAQTANECLEKGMSTGDTMTLSIIAGAAEVITERVSIEALLDTETLAGNVSRYIKNNAYAEGSEEVASDFINLVADIAIRGEESDAYQKINTTYNMLRDTYIEAGMSVEEAESTALAEAIMQASMEQIGSSAMSFVGGALSGGVMAGANAARYNNATAQLGQQIVDEGRGSVERLVNEGLNADTQSNVYKMAQQLQNELNSQEEVDVEAVGDLYNAVQEYQEGRQETVTEIGNAVTELEENGMVSNSTVNSLMHNNDAVEMLTSYTDVEITGNRSQRQEAVRKALAEFSTRMNEENAETETTEEAENTPVNQSISEQNTADEEVIGNNTAIENNPVNQSISAENAHQNITQEEVIENEGTEREETAESSSRNEGRSVSLDASEISKRFQSGEQLSYQDRRKLQEERRNYFGTALQSVREVSAKSIGIEGASVDANIKVIPSSSYLEDLKTISNVAESVGKEVVFFSGAFGIEDGGSGRGYCWSDGSKLFVRADHYIFTPEQLVKHEVFHSLVNEGKIDVNALREALRGKYTESQLEDIFRSYLKLYSGVDITVDEMWEEILADAYAGLNAFEDSDFAEYRAASVLTDAVNENIQNATTDNVAPSQNGKFSRDASVDENFDKHLSESIMQNEVTSLQSIGRRAITTFTDSERYTSSKWANRMWEELKTKSPFFKAWFGDWRLNDKTPVTYSTSDSKIRTLTAGKTVNTDTGRTISWGNQLKSETSFKNKNTSPEVGMFGDIEEIVKNAILLDTYPSSRNKNSKMPNTAFMHSFYGIALQDGTYYLYKMYVEEAMNNKLTDSFSRGYELQAIEKVATLKGVPQQNSVGLSHSVATYLPNSVAELADIVKSKDQNYNPETPSLHVCESDGTPKVFYTDDIKSDVVYAEKGENSKEVYASARNTAKVNSVDMTDAEISVLKNNGFDSAVDADGNIRVFSDEQIKYANENRGTFDSNRGALYSRDAMLSDDLKSLQKTNRELNRLLDKTRTQLENARKQTKITSEANKWTVRYEDAKRSAIALKNSFENAKLTIPTKRVADMQKSLADLYMQTDISKEELNKKAIEYAKEIIDSAEIFHDPDAMDFASKVKNEIGRGIYISAKDKAQITDYGDFKKNHPGLKMSTANAELQTLDELWSSLAKSFPGEFDAELTGASERLTALYEVLDDYQTRYMSFDTAYAIETTAQSMLISAMDDSMRLVAPTYADTQAEKFDRAMEKARDSKNKALADQRERYNDKIADLKADKQEALSELRAEKNEKLRDQRTEFMAEKQEALSELRTEKNKKLVDLRQELTAKADEALAREKNRRVEEIQELKDKQRAKDKKRIEERQKREAREKLEKHVKKLSSDLLSNTKEHHVPEVYRNAVAEALSLINLSSNYKEIYQNKRYPKKGVRFETTRVNFLDENGNKNKYFDVLGFETKKTQAFNALKEQYQAIANRTVADDGLYVELEGKLVEGDLVSAVRELAGTPVSAMTLEQITMVSDFVTAIEASIKNYNRMLSESNYAMAGDFAYALYKNNEWKDEKKIGGVVGDFATLDTLTPEAYFYRLGDTGREMFRMMRYSQDKYIKLIEEASEFTHKIEKDFGVDRSKLDNDMRTVKLGGREYQISASQIMALYALSQREQGLQHILQGGIKILDLNKKNAFKQTYARVIHGITIEQLNNAFSDQNVLHLNERQAADTLQNYMSTTLADWGNEASMTVYGYKKFTEGKYFPIRVNSEELMKDPSAKERLSYTVANRGFTKDLSKFANQSVYIGSFFDEMSGHTSEMATYSAWLATMEDLRRIRQYKFTEEFTGSFESVSDILAHVHGTGGSAYFDNLMRDLANGVHSEKAYFGGAVGNWKAAAVGANLRVILQQPTAVLRAADMIGAKYMAKASNPLDLMKAYDEAKKYCPIAVWKDWGYFDLNTGKSIRDILFDSKNATDKAREAFMKPAGVADSVAWGYLWKACKAEISDKTDLKVGSEEYFKAVADRFNEVIDHTQVVDGVLQRSQVMRNGNGLVKMAASFMAEPTKQVNMFMSSVYDVQHAESNTAKKTAKKQLARTTSALIVAGVTNAIVQSFVDALRHNDPDDDESYLEQLLEEFIGYKKGMSTKDFIKAFAMSNLFDVFNPASYFVYAKDVWSLLQGYDVERTDMSGIADLIQSVNYFTKALSGNGSTSTANALLNLIGKASSVFGIPIYNIKRDLFAVMNNIAASAPPLWRFYNANFQYKVTGDTKRFVGILYDAYKTDPEAYKIIYNELVKNGLDAESIKSKMENLMKKDEGVASVSDLESRWYAPEQQEAHDELAEPITSNRLWDAATDDMRDKVDGYMYDLALENTNGVKLSEKLEDAGVDTSTYLLYNLALSIHDEPTESGKLGTYTNGEKEAAIDELHLSRELASALWMLAVGTDKNNPYK